MATKKIRILVDTEIDGQPYRCNDAVELDEKLAAQAVKSGMADDAPEAVKYVTDALKAKVKKHGAKAEQAKEPAKE